MSPFLVDALRDLIAWIRAAEGSCYSVSIRVSRVYQAEFKDIQRELEKLKRRAEKLTLEIENDERR